MAVLRLPISHCAEQRIDLGIRMIRKEWPPFPMRGANGLNNANSWQVDRRVAPHSTRDS